MAGPRIEATAVIIDKATPELEKLARIAAEMGVKMGDGMSNGITAGTDKVMAQLEKMRNELRELTTSNGAIDALKVNFQELGVAVREALGVGVVKEFATTMKTQGVAAVDAVKVSATTAADQIRGTMRVAREETGLLSRELKQTAGLLASIYGYEKGKEAISGGAHIESLKVRMQALGLDSKTQSEYLARAQEMRDKYSGITTSEGLKTQMELRGVLPHAEEVGEMTEPAVRMIRALRATNPELSDEELSSTMQSLYKAAELFGRAKSPEALSKFFDSVVKNKTYAGGLLPLVENLNAAKQGGLTIGLTDDEFAEYIAPITMTEMGGFRFGTAMQSLQRFKAHGYARKLWQVGALHEAGLIRDDQVEYNKQGNIKGVHGDLKDQDLLDRNPFEWITTTFRDAIKTYQASEAKRGHKLSDADVAKQMLRKAVVEDENGKEVESTETIGQIAKAAGISDNAQAMRELTTASILLGANGPSVRLVSSWLAQEQAIRNHAKNAHEAAGVDASIDFYKKDPIVALKTLSTAVEEFGAVLTSSSMPGAAKALAYLADNVRSFTASLGDMAKNNPLTAEMLGVGAIAGTGYLGIKAATGVTNLFAGGFGLSASAAALDGSAAALTEAAAVLAAGGGGGTGKLIKDAGATLGIGLMGYLRRLTTLGAMFFLPGDTPEAGSGGKAMDNATSQFYADKWNKEHPDKQWGPWFKRFLLGDAADGKGLLSHMGIDNHVQGALPTRGGPLPVTLTNPTAQKVEGKADVNVNVKLDASAIQQTIKARAQVNLGQGFSTGQSPSPPAMGPR